MERILRYLRMLITPTAVVVCLSFNGSSQTVTSNGVSLQLNECRYAAGLVTCYLKITSNGFDRNIGKGFRFDGKSNWNITDDLGNSFPHREIWFGGKEKWDSGDFIGTLVADLPTPMNFVFEFRPDAKIIQLLDLFIVVADKVVSFQFRNVPIIDDSPKMFSGKIQSVYNGTALAFEACERQTTSLICKFTAISSGKDRQPNTSWGNRELKVVDDLGNYYRPEDALWGGKRSNTLIANTPTPVVVTIRNFNPSATSLALIEIHFQDRILLFRNIEIGTADNYIVSKTSIAVGKPVYVNTNGMEDASDAGNHCNNPNEITDGSLLYASVPCARDGVVGFQNHDYNQLMEVTVTINLQGTYNITKIRYNQGNVQRAETWNADSMTTPFGTVSTVAGSPSRGAWTEQVGSITTSVLEIKFRKTRRAYAEDWLYIGEIEVIGSPANSSRIKPPREQIKIGFAMVTMKDRKSQDIRDAFETQCKKLQINCTITVANGNPDRQANDIDNLLTQGVDVLFIIPFNPNHAAAMARKAKIHNVLVASSNSLTVGATVDLVRAICSFEGARGRELCNQVRNLGGTQ